MPSKSKSQQRLFGMVHAYQKGDLDTDKLPKSLAKKIKDIATGKGGTRKPISKKSAKDFAKTKPSIQRLKLTKTLKATV